MSKTEEKCTKCHKEKAEWFGIGDDDLCQLCWEAYCSEQWWATHCGTIEPAEVE